jgi:glycosyltransferase involved in cell wall biosynthesis
MNCCICGPVKNCASYLNKVLQNMEKIGSIFDNYEIIIFYDESQDNTLDILKEYQQINPKMKFYVNKNPISKFRTHNLAFARNFCLNYIKANNFPFFIMMDMDDVNCKEVNVEVLRNYLNRDDWDGLSFNTSPKYYDIWGLSIYPYCFSYNHFSNKYKNNYQTIQNYINYLLNNIPSDSLLPCISSFNGFSIYRTDKFLNTYYDGRVRLDIIPKRNLLSHMKIANSRIMPQKHPTLDGKYEDCEHRTFHIQARQNSGARIMISPEVLFS